MRKLVTIALAISLLVVPLSAQTSQQPNPQQQQPPPPPPQQREISPDDVLRITTELVQTDVVVTDKSERIISDLKLEDFEVLENGKKQDLQFMEFISVDEPGRSEGTTTNIARIAPGIDTSVPTDTTAADLRRVIGFVVDDVTIPSEDMSRVRDMLTNFVDTKMRSGDLVAIVRTVGGKGLLEQFTTDKQILRRAINQLGVRSVPPHLAFGGPEAGRVASTPTAAGGGAELGGPDQTATDTVASSDFSEGPTEGTNQIPRSVLALSVANQMIDGLRQVPGRKNLVLMSGGLPMFAATSRGSIVADVTQLFRILTENATRSGVVINTMDVRGLSTIGAVAKFQDTPGKSALGGGTLAGNDGTPGFGRTMDTSRLGGELSLSEQLTLRILAAQTGGVSVVNSNNFNQGLERVLRRSRGYYRLAYKPTEKFDNKFHKVEVKVRRSGVQVFTGEGYIAREDRGAASATKEAQIIKAAISPLAKRDLDVTAELQYVFTNNQADLTINAFIHPGKLDFKRVGDRYQASFDVVGFVIDQVGRSRGGISQTVNADLTEQSYKRAMATGLSYTATTQLPPGYYQVRLVVRETDTGKMGSVSRYFEVPDLTQKRLTMSSIMLYEVSPTGAKKTPDQLAATRVISRKQDLRYASVVYNARTEGGKPQVSSRTIISVNNKILFQEPEQKIETPGTEPGQLIRVGQLALAKVPPGRYVLTLVITDPLAEKKRQTISRNIDFTVVD